MENLPTTPKHLTSREKAAILCVVLGDDFTAQVYASLSNENEIDELSHDIARFESVPPNLADRVLQEFRETMVGHHLWATGGMDAARAGLVKAFGAERAEQILKRVEREMNDAGLSRLRKAEPEQLANQLYNQYPQATAVILAHLNPIQSAEVISKIEADLATEVVYRMAILDKVSPEVLAIIEDAIAAGTDMSFSAQATAAGGPSAVAEVLNLMGGAAEGGILDLLGQRDPELAEQIRSQMFTWTDLIQLGDKQIRKVIARVEDVKDLALAFKKTEEGLKELILNNMTERARRGLEDEIEVLGAVRVKDVEDAQGRIIGIVRDLEDEGEIVIASGSGEDALID